MGARVAAAAAVVLAAVPPLAVPADDAAPVAPLAPSPGAPHAPAPGVPQAPAPDAPLAVLAPAVGPNEEAAAAAAATLNLPLKLLNDNMDEIV